MKYQEVVGQQIVKKYLTDVVGGNRLPHALLFIGNSGHGPLPMALATAQFLMCQDRTQTDACGKCISCHKATKFIHPDIHFSFPTIGSKVTSSELLPEWRQFLTQNPYGDVQDWLSNIGGENKQGNINKDECHRILRALSLKTFEGPYKIHILWMAEYLGKEGNRLLKIIEEPPDNTVFILIAVNQEDILNTILSRCQIVPFASLTDDQITQDLMKRNPNLLETDALQLTYLADGNLGKALGQLQDGSNISTDMWLEWMRIAFRGSGLEMVKWTDGFAKLDREAQKRFLHYGLHFLREMLLSKISTKMNVRLLPEEKDALKKLKKLVTLKNLQEMIDMIENGIYYLERNANTKILMLDNCIRMHHMFQDVNHYTAKVKN